MKELGLIDRVLQMLASDKDFCLHAMECGFPSPLDYMLEEKDGMDSILYMATDHYGRKFSSPSELNGFLEMQHVPTLLDRNEMYNEFIEPAKALILSIVTNSSMDGMMMGDLISANKIRSYFSKIRGGDGGYTAYLNESSYFVGRRCQYFAGVAEFIDSMNRFSSSMMDEVIDEEMTIMLGIIEIWEKWEVIGKNPELTVL